VTRAPEYLEALSNGLNREGTHSAANRPEWFVRQVETASANGFFRLIDSDHSAFALDGSSTLLVTFEAFGQLFERENADAPWAFELAQTYGWSTLCLLAHRQTWYRSPAVAAFFDELTDEGIFDTYDRILFFGSGMCGYAAAAYSAAAPGSRFVVLQPQASLDPRLTGWDTRFVEKRRLSFEGRFGYAPDMTDAAECGYVLFDPDTALDSMHATLFRRPHVQLIPCRGLSGPLDIHLRQMGVLAPLLAQGFDTTLSAQTFWRLFRARRTYKPYLRRLLSKTEQRGRPYLSALTSQYAMKTVGGRRFRKARTEISHRKVRETV
jgi:hypothetical protein